MAKLLRRCLPIRSNDIEAAEHQLVLRRGFQKRENAAVGSRFPLQGRVLRFDLDAPGPLHSERRAVSNSDVY